MLANEHVFELFVSRGNYPVKPSTDAEISKIVFEHQQLTIEDALKLAKQGNAFCYNFHTKNGVLPIKYKKSETFNSTSVIFYDFDKMETSMHAFIESIPYKPTYAYTSYSNGENGLYRYRLVYVLRNTLYSEENFEEIYYAIGNANQFIKETKEHGGWDVRSVSQFYYGTNPNADTYIGEIIYPIELFQKYIVYKENVQDNCSCNTRMGSSIDVKVNQDFLTDFHSLDYNRMFKKYFDAYHDTYMKSLETPLLLSEDEMYYEYPEDYVSVIRKRKGKYTLKWDIGQDRKKKLYISAQIMLHNQPDMTIENLIYNLIIERRWYYENKDKKITNQVIYDTAVNAYRDRIDINPTKHGKFRVNKEYWENEQGVSAQSAKGYIRRQMNVKRILPYIDENKSIKENYNILLDNNITISYNTLKNMVSSGEIKIINNNPTDTLLSQFRNSDTIKQVISLIKEDDKITIDRMSNILNVKPLTIKRCIKKIKGILIDREGSNQSGRWIILNDEMSEKVNTGDDKQVPCTRPSLIKVGYYPDYLFETGLFPNMLLIPEIWQHNEMVA